MNYTILNCEQRSDEWRAARLGKLTGSCADAMLTTIKSGESAARRNLRTRLVLERLTNRSQESDFMSADMVHGIDTEPEARAAYEALTGNLVEGVGFLQHTDLMAGCSPDGLIGDCEGLVSIKCPKSATHLEALRTKKVPLEYLRQITHELWLTGAQWADYLSFDPRFPPELRRVLLRVQAEWIDVKAYEGLVEIFLREVTAECDELRKLMVAA